MLVALLALVAAGCSNRHARPGREIRLVSYNVHNLFDDRPDGTEFRGYRPGQDEWGSVEFHAKAERTADAVRRSIPGRGGYPDILALQEIENEHALEVLLGEYMTRSGYRWFVMPPRSGGAFRVAAVSRYPVRAARVHALRYLDFVPRDILEVTLEVGDSELTLFVNHWPSRRGGVEETAPLRRFTAAALARRIDRLLDRDAEAAVIVAGDLNMPPDELEPVWVGTPLYNGWTQAQFPGSYHFRGSWSRIDHILFSDGARDGRFTLTGFAVVADEPFLDRYGTPQVWFPGTSRGYSDHLPLRATLSLNRSADSAAGD